MTDPFTHINRVHREAVDSPYGPADRGPPHRLRSQWREPDRGRHLRVEDFDTATERLARFIRRAGFIVAGGTLVYFLASLLPR